MQIVVSDVVEQLKKKEEKSNLNKRENLEMKYGAGWGRGIMSSMSEGCEIH